MSLFTTSLTSITPEALNRLVEHQVREGLQLEFKRDLPGNSDADKREFLADVSSFANARGGDIVFGVAEANDVPESIPGVPRDLVGAAVQRLEALVRDGIEPRVQGVRTHEVSVSSTASALIMRVPRSMSAPHMVALGNLSRFYARTSRGKFQLDVNELRTAFLETSATLDAARAFRADRLGSISRRELPIALHDNPRVILHIVPAGLLGFDIEALHNVRPQPLHSSRSDGRFNYEGVLYYSPPDPRPSAHTYLQFFRDGTIETVAASLIDASDDRDADGPMISSVPVEKAVIREVEHCLELYTQLEVPPPFIVMITLLGVQGFRIMPKTANRHWDSFRLPLDRDLVLLPEAVVNELPVDVPALLRPCFDVMWQAGGWDGSMNYDDKGHWSPT